VFDVCGFVAGSQLFGHNTDTENATIRITPRESTGITTRILNGNTLTLDTIQDHRSGGVTGCNIFVKKTIGKRIGLLDGRHQQTIEITALRPISDTNLLILTRIQPDLTIIRYIITGPDNV
jgi:hypothetical protein